VATKGCSVQREAIASTDELKQWIGSYQHKNTDHTWMGTLASDCRSLRGIQLSDKTNRVVAVYDTAERENPAHAEIFQTEHVIDDADRLELRAEIYKRFGNGALIIPSAYRSGALRP
jgi:IMP cyclohydrolase